MQLIAQDRISNSISNVTTLNTKMPVMVALFMCWHFLKT